MSNKQQLSYIEETSKGYETIPVNSRLLTDRKIFIDEAINTETLIDFAKQMMIMADTEEPVSIYINCPGGEVNAGLAMYDIIQSYPGEIKMYCVGMAASMAAVLLAAGQKGKRFILPHSRVMIHEVLLGGGVGGSATSISKISESITKTRDLVNQILADHTGKTLGEINDATSFDNFMNADEAVEFGICDTVVTSIF